MVLKRILKMAITIFSSLTKEKEQGLFLLSWHCSGLALGLAQGHPGNGFMFSCV